MTGYLAPAAGARARQVCALLLAGVLAGALAIGLRELSAFAWLENRTTQARFSLRGEQPPSPDVVVVALDVESIRVLDDQPPIARATDAVVVDNLRRAGARVVAFDFTLEQPSEDRAGDLGLARALARTGAAVVAAITIRSGARTQPLVGRREFDGSRVQPGYISLPTDDGVMRRFPTAFEGVPTIAAVAAMLHGGRSAVRDPPPGALIDFRGQAGKVPTLRFSDVLANRFDGALVRGRVVVVGPTAPQLQDLHATAAGGPPMSGPEIHANAIATAIEGYPLRAMSSGATALLLLILGGAVAGLLAIRGGRLGPASVAVAGVAVLGAWTVAAHVAFDTGSVVDYSAGAFAVLASCAGCGALVSIFGRRERRELRELFAAYSPNVVRRVLAQGATEPAGITNTEIISGYRLREVIGEGGMGVVYRATDVRLDREVALKLIRPQFALRSLYRARFERETRTAALIGHPNIVPVFDAGEDDGLLYIAMMLVEGVDLARTVRVFGALEHGLLVTVLRQIASALDAAHAQGLVHRDVKPENVLVTTDPRHAYLTDFGIAKRLGDDDGLTRTGSWVGTVDYLAPELAGGEDASPLSDVYALAAVLFYCVTGNVPFDLPTEAAKLRAHAEATPPSVSGSAPGTPLKLDAVIARGMAKVPAERYETASELAEAAARALGLRSRTPRARPPRRPSRHARNATTQ